MIKLAEPGMWEDLQELWQNSFGDGAYTRFIFEKLLRPENILVHTGKKKRSLEEFPCAMLCMEPFTLEIGMSQAQGVYVYGVATDPEVRGQGLSTELLSRMHSYLRRRGVAASVLVPAGESLFGFYEKRGYRTAFSVRELDIPAPEVRAPALPCILTPASLYRLEELRNLLLGKRRMYVRWSREYLYYIGEECRLLGGEVLAISGTGREGFVVCYPLEDRIIVKEMAVGPRRFEDVLAALHARYRAARYQIRIPEDFDCGRPSRPLPFAMVRWYDKTIQARCNSYIGQPPYISHVLD